MSASAFSLTAAIPTPGFEILRGEPVSGALRQPDVPQFFCPQCMTWMFTLFRPEFVNVRVTTLDDPSWFTPYLETWTKTKLPWVTTPAVRRYPEFPPLEDYAKLATDFSQWFST
jgi:hypothetical protein